MNEQPIPYAYPRAGRSGFVVALTALVAVAGCGTAGPASPAESEAPIRSPANPSATASSSASATALRDAGGPLSPGQYLVGEPFQVPLVLTLPDGWATNALEHGAVSLVKRHDADRNAAFASFFLVDGVYADPCAGGSPDETAAADPETLVDALRAQPGFELGELSEGTLDGRPTWTWEIVPAIDISTCADDPWLYQVTIPTGEGESIDGGTVGDAIQRFTVVDLGGTALIAEVGTFTWTREDDLFEATEIIESVEFAQP